MKKITYFAELSKLFPQIEAVDKNNRSIALEAAITRSIQLILAQYKKGNKLIFIGNGGSASIASHFAIDFLKNARIPALAFNDASFLTCLSNDLGYEQVFAKPIEMLAKKGDILVAISSSGKSKNILEATRMAKKKGCLVITLSGFNSSNPLRKLGDLNFYVPSNSYGYVETIHAAICHCIVDTIINKKSHG